jgi:hypothetical protein
MRITRTLAPAAIAAVLALALTGCFGNLLGGGGGSTTAVDLTGTSWSGVDSDGDATAFEFEADGTVLLTFKGESFDDASDTWSQSGNAVTVNVYFNDTIGTAVYTGDIAGESINLTAVGEDGSSWTLALTQD